MRFSIDRHLGKKFVPAAACPKPFAVRFASIAIAAVLAASFIPLAAFADEGEPAEAEGDRNLSTQVTATASTAAEGGGVSIRKGM